MLLRHERFSRVFQRRLLSTVPRIFPQTQPTLKGKSRAVNQDEGHGDVNVSPFFNVPALAPQHDA